MPYTLDDYLEDMLDWEDDEERENNKVTIDLVGDTIYGWDYIDEGRPPMPWFTDIMHLTLDNESQNLILASMQAGSQFPKFDSSLGYWVSCRGWRRVADTEWFMNHIGEDGHETDADDVVCELIDMWEGRLP